MSNYPDGERQFRADLVSAMVRLMRQQRAPWQRADRADLPAPALPYNGIAGTDRVFSSTNALTLIAAMQAHGWDDPRFVTAKQAEDAGWRVRPGGGTNLIFWHGLKTTGEGLGARVTGNQIRTSIITLYNAAEVIGMPELEQGEPVAKIDMQVFAQTVGGRSERAHLLSSSALARRAAVQLLGEPSKGDEWRHNLRVQLASYLFTRISGELYRPSIEPVSQLPLTARLLEDPDEFFRAARDGQAVAREIAKLAQTMKPEKATVSPQLQPSQAKAGAQGERRATAEPSADASKEAHIFLAIPFSELGQAKAAGAWWNKKYKGWCVLADSDVSKVQKWIPKTQLLDLKDVRDSFSAAMRAHGLVEPLGGPIDDNKWHYVPTADSKGNQKKGAYIFNTKAAVPHGYIKNFKGTAGSWRYDGTSVSPEVRAAYDAQARAQAALRDQELQRQQQVIAAQTASVLSNLPQASAAAHPYLERKGVDAHGLFLCSDDAQLQTLLNMETFKGRGDIFLVVPGRDIEGNVRTAQAIPGNDQGSKLFAAGAAKKGAFHLIGAANVKELAQAQAVFFAEGYATAAQVYEDMDRQFPAVVTFDAGNLIEVAKVLSKHLPEGQAKIVCCDNDQFMIERALDQIRLVMPNLGTDLQTGASVQVQAGDGAGLRTVSLGPVLADNEWHETAEGKYRLSIEKRAGIGVDRVRVDTQRKDSDKHVQLMLENKGRTSGEEAARILGGRAVVPAFASLQGRPTDFNDLGSREGSLMVRKCVEASLDIPKSEAVLPQQAERARTTARPAPGHAKR